MIPMRNLPVSLPLLLLLCVWAMPGAARAWDPSSTHMGMVEAAVRDSPMHRRWMEATGLQRGVFSPLQVDPDRLTGLERRTLELAFRHAHGAAGGIPLGGPGACPGPQAPAETRKYCATGDRWETTALGWIRAGILVEVTPRTRLVHHFTDLQQPETRTWADPELSATVLRYRQTRSNGAPVAGLWTRTNFDGTGPSALAWLQDDVDPWAPAQLYAHLQRASLAADPQVRSHHLAMALVCTGALLHVVQDLTVPAHARGDASAFFAKLSDHRHDRGLPLQEYARATFGRALPSAPVTLAPRTAEQREPAPVPTTGEPLATSLPALLWGTEQWEGLVHRAGRRFLSESTLPAPQALSDALSPEQAAAAMLTEEAHVDPQTVRGARLRPWPAQTGYLLTRTGRPLAAFDTDPRGRTRLYLDAVVYRDQSLHLIPTAVAASRAVLGLLWPDLGAIRRTGPTTAELELPTNLELQTLEIAVLSQHKGGQRKVHERRTLEPAPTVTVALPRKLPEATHPVLVVLATTADGQRLVAERSLGRDHQAGQPEPRRKSDIRTTTPREKSPPTRHRDPDRAQPAPEPSETSETSPSSDPDGRADPEAPDAEPSPEPGAPPAEPSDPEGSSPPAEPGPTSPDRSPEASAPSRTPPPDPPPDPRAPAPVDPAPDPPG